MDFIIVGAGSAGAVVATRLTEDPSVNVLVLECGRSDIAVGLELRIPLTAGKLQFKNASFPFYTEEQKFASFASTKQQVHLPTGKTLGGGSSINYLAYVRGAAADYDEWQQSMGADGWSFKDVLPYFKKSECCQCIDLLEKEFHGVDGPLPVSIRSPRNPIVTDFINACGQVGYPNLDYNGKDIAGASYFQTTSMKGERASTAFAYLHPSMHRKNLHVVTEANVTRILFSQDGKKAIGVEYMKNNKIVRVFASKEVIVSAGSLNTPKILQLSGIGPAPELKKWNIDLIKDLPVGLNLQDHCFTTICCIGPPKKNIGSINGAKALGFPSGLLSLAEWFLHGTGIFASTCYDGNLFCHSGVRPHLPYPDLQISVMTTGGDAELIYKNLNVSPEWPYPPEVIGPNAEAFIILVTLVHPVSRGSVTLKSTDSQAHPAIQPNYLQEDVDLKTLMAGCKIAMKILQQGAMKDTFGRAYFHPKLLQKHNNKSDSDAFWEDHIRHFCTTLYHPTSTCAIGKVVDPQLKVYGMQGLRVADASIMPQIMTGNTNAPSIMIGEKAADMIAKEYGYMNKSQVTLSANENYKRKRQTLHRNIALYVAVIATSITLVAAYLMK